MCRLLLFLCPCLRTLSASRAVRARRSVPTRGLPLFGGVGMHPSGPCWPHSCAPLSSPPVTILGRDPLLSHSPSHPSHSRGRCLSYLVRGAASCRNGDLRSAPGPNPAPPHDLLHRLSCRCICIRPIDGPGAPLSLGPLDAITPLSPTQRAVVSSVCAGMPGIWPLSLRLRKRLTYASGPSPL